MYLQAICKLVYQINAYASHALPSASTHLFWPCQSPFLLLQAALKTSTTAKKFKMLSNDRLHVRVYRGNMLSKTFFVCQTPFLAQTAKHRINRTRNQEVRFIRSSAKSNLRINRTKNLVPRPFDLSDVDCM